MLQSIRDRTSGLIAGFVVAIIVVPFAFWGVESFIGGGGDPVVAKVGGEKIHESQFRQNYEQRYQQYLQLMGENFRADQFDAERFRNSVLDDMTQESMLRQYTEDAGYGANDTVLFRAITTIPAFQVDGKFDANAYKAALANQGLTPERFEAQLRQSLEIDQMREAVVDTAFMTPVEVRQLLQLAGQTREAAYALFPLSAYQGKLSVSDDEARSRYDETKDQYMAPERIKLAYVELAPDTAGEVAAPSADMLKTLYDAEKDSRFTSAEERKVRHLLVGFGADKGAAEKKAEGFAEQLKNGADFAALAKANSDDAGSKAAGGEIGWLRRGQMPDSFEKALWSLKAGETSKPVETEFGWHLIHVDEIKAPTARPFDDAEVQSELVELYRNRERQQHFQEVSEKFEQLAFENPASLDAVAKELKLPVQTSDWLTRAGGSGIAATAAVQQAAFSPEVLKDGENSKPIAVGENRLVVVRKAEYEAPRQRSFDEVAAQVRSQLQDDKAKAQVLAEAQAALKAARDGKTLEEAIAGKNAQIKSLGQVRRDDRSVDPALVAELFKLPRPASGKQSFAQVQLGSGDVAVLALSSVDTPSASEVQAAEAQRFSQLAAGMEFQAYRNRIASQLKVERVNAPQAPADPTQ